MEGEIRCVGKGGFSLRVRERDRSSARRRELRGTEGAGLRKAEEGPRKIVGEKETYENVSLCELWRVCVLVRRIESAAIKRAGRSKTNNEDETTKSVRTPERGAPLQRRVQSKREEETEIATETKVASFGRARERGVKSWRGRRAREKGRKREERAR